MMIYWSEVVCLVLTPHYNILGSANTERRGDHLTGETKGQLLFQKRPICK